MKIKIVTETTEAFAKLNNTKTASAVAETLPFESAAHRWGDEVYFEIPLELKIEDGKEILEIGEIAYWPPGKSLCIFFGPTPSCRGNEVRAYSPVTVFGKIIGDAMYLALI